MLFSVVVTVVFQSHRHGGTISGKHPIFKVIGRDHHCRALFVRYGSGDPAIADRKALLVGTPGKHPHRFADGTADIGRSRGPAIVHNARGTSVVTVYAAEEVVGTGLRSRNPSAESASFDQPDTLLVGHGHDTAYHDVAFGGVRTLDRSGKRASADPVSALRLGHDTRSAHFRRPGNADRTRTGAFFDDKPVIRRLARNELPADRFARNAAHEIPARITARIVKVGRVVAVGDRVQPVVFLNSSDKASDHIKSRR